VNGNIFNSKGVHVGVVMDDAVFGLKGQKLYDLKGSNIYKLNGDLVGHLSNARGAEKRLGQSNRQAVSVNLIFLKIHPLSGRFAVRAYAATIPPGKWPPRRSHHMPEIRREPPSPLAVCHLS
jgi:sporulation protein YlmC with PRC-barrel domain